MNREQAKEELRELAAKKKELDEILRLTGFVDIKDEKEREAVEQYRSQSEAIGDFIDLLQGLLTII